MRKTARDERSSGAAKTLLFRLLAQKWNQASPFPLNCSVTQREPTQLGAPLVCQVPQALKSSCANRWKGLSKPPYLINCWVEGRTTAQRVAGSWPHTANEAYLCPSSTAHLGCSCVQPFPSAALGFLHHPAWQTKSLSVTVALGCLLRASVAWLLA